MLKNTLKKTLAFGLLAAGTIGLAVPAHAQNVTNGSQTIESQTVGVNGSHVFSQNEQDLQQVIVESEYGNYGSYEQPNVILGNQDIGAAAVGANGSHVFSNNEQDQSNVIVDSDAGNYSSYYPYYPQPTYEHY